MLFVQSCAKRPDDGLSATGMLARLMSATCWVLARTGYSVAMAAWQLAGVLGNDQSGMVTAILVGPDATQAGVTASLGHGS